MAAHDQSGPRRPRLDADVDLRALLDALPDAVLLVDRDGRVRFANREIEPLLGWAPESLVGQRIEVLVPPSVLPHHEATRSAWFAAPRRAGMAGSRRLMARHRDGHEVDVHIELAPLDDGERGPLALVTVRDVREQRRLFGLLEQTGAVLDQAQHVARLGTFVFEAGPRPRVVLSEGLFRIYGLEPTPDGTYHELFRYVFPDDLARVRATVDAEMVGRPARQLDYRIVRPDGEVRHLRRFGNHVYDGDRLVRMAGLVQDVTEQVVAGERLAASERRFRLLVERSTELVSLLRRDGTRFYVTPAITAILGYTPEEYVALPIRELVHPDDLASLGGPPVSHTPTTPGGSVVLRYRLRHKNGRWRWLEGTFTNHLADPDLGAIVLNQRDITEQLALESKMAQAEKMEAITRLAGGVAHDFNNLLSVISGFTALVAARLPDEATQTDLAEVTAATDRAIQLTRQLLAFARRQVLRPRVFDLGEQVRAMQRLLERTAGEAVTVGLDISAEPALVKADLGQIEQVLINLVMYARDAMPGGGELHLAVGPGSPGELGDAPGPASWVQLTVRHTGPTLSPEAIARLFEPFRDEPGAPATFGLGLGLASVYGIVTQSHGQIAVTSAPGQGTTFRIHLPASTDVAPVVVAKSSAPAAGHTVLLVEDEPAVRKLARAILVADGYEVLEAGTGAQALSLAELHPGRIDVLVTDVVMPGMSGPQLAEHLGRRRPGLRVIYMSGYLPDTVAHHGLAEGGDLIEKPLTPGALRAKVRELLQRPAEAS